TPIGGSDTGAAGTAPGFDIVRSTSGRAIPARPKRGARSSRGAHVGTSTKGGIVRIGTALRWSAIPAMLAALVLFLPEPAAAAPAPPAAAQHAAVAAAVPAPPAGWTLTWADDFNSCAGCGVDANSWRYDTGTGVFGTGEI